MTTHMSVSDRLRLLLNPDRLVFVDPPVDDIEIVLDVLPDLLREDSRDGDALRARLGLRLDHTRASLGPMGMAVYGGVEVTAKAAAMREWYESRPKIGKPIVVNERAERAEAEVARLRDKIDRVREAAHRLDLGVIGAGAAFAKILDEQSGP